MNIPVKRILLVEDNPNDAELTLEGLDRSNLLNEVLWVKDGEEALNYLYHRGAYTGRPDNNPIVILLDIKLPKVDGLEVLRIIREDPKLKYIPVVILTSSAEERDVVEGYRLGVNAYVVKPLEFKEFMDAVTELGVFWAICNEPPPNGIGK